jgi:hypothetical protein
MDEAQKDILALRKAEITAKIIRRSQGDDRRVRDLRCDACSNNHEQQQAA